MSFAAKEREEKPDFSPRKFKEIGYSAAKREGRFTAFPMNQNKNQMATAKQKLESLDKEFLERSGSYHKGVWAFFENILNRLWMTRSRKI